MLRGKLRGWEGKSYAKAGTFDGELFSFLGHVDRLRDDWNIPGTPKLWLYNLHYQDYLNTRERQFDPFLGMHLLDSWIIGNPPAIGNGWEPYCLSLRIVNWVKFLSCLPSNAIKKYWLESLALQSSVLVQKLEFHILGNHLFANAKALIFAGSYLGGPQSDGFLKIGIKILDEQIGEQFLDDGAHFELSPMYHSLLLWDIADLIMLAKQTKIPELLHRVNIWEKKFSAGLQWLLNMTHPDSSIAFFNDATFGIAPDVEFLKDYAYLLNIAKPALSFVSGPRGTLLEESGFGVIEWSKRHRLILDLAQVGPDYQPGHAHADTLSCELSLFDQRVIVNSGISEYGNGPERQRQRSTSAHNTVVVNGQNSSEVWSGFRVARRARPHDVELKVSTGEVSLEGWHDGYCRLFNKIMHHRRCRAKDNFLEIQDSLFGVFDKASAHWHFHPDVTILQENDWSFYLAFGKGGGAHLYFRGGKARLVQSTWHPSFGAEVESKKLIVDFEGSVMTACIDWSSM